MARLSVEGRETAEAAARRVTRLDLVELVAVWAGCVCTISSDQGEKYYDDYFGYLQWREAIDELMAALPEADASVVRNAVEPADTHFQNHTIDDGGAALSRKFRLPTDAWYWRRVPISGPIARSLDVEQTRS